MYYVGTCPKCKQGLLGVRVCGGEGRHVVILCDECDATWQTPETSRRPVYPKQPDLPCPECGKSLRQKPARWARIRDLRRAGWEDDIEGEYSSRREPRTKSE